MMTKYHVSEDGQARACVAKDESSCRKSNGDLVVPHGDFESSAEAQKWASEEFEKTLTNKAIPQMRKSTVLRLAALESLGTKVSDLEPGAVYSVQGYAKGDGPFNLTANVDFDRKTTISFDGKGVYVDDKNAVDSDDAQRRAAEVLGSIVISLNKVSGDAAEPSERITNLSIVKIS